MATAKQYQDLLDFTFQQREANPNLPNLRVRRFILFRQTSCHSLDRHKAADRQL